MQDINFLWVKTPKCGGTSILELLKKEPFVGIIRWGKVGMYQKRNNGVFNKSFKFAFVRNPYDRLVSSYFYSLQKGWFSGDFKQFAATPLHALDRRACQHTQPLTLHLSLRKYEYRKNCFAFTPDESLPEIDYLDAIYKLENIQQDLDKLFDQMGLQRKQLPHINKTSHRHYTEHYDDEIRAIVAENYAQDIECFKYDYGE